MLMMLVKYMGAVCGGSGRVGVGKVGGCRVGGYVK